MRSEITHKAVSPENTQRSPASKGKIQLRKEEKGRLQAFIKLRETVLYCHTPIQSCIIMHWLSVDGSAAATKLDCSHVIGWILLKPAYCSTHTCKSTYFFTLHRYHKCQPSNKSLHHQRWVEVTRYQSYRSKSLILVYFSAQTYWLSKLIPSGPPVEFVDPPEQLEVRVGERARLHCEFRSSSVPVACCWIYNRNKVIITGAPWVLSVVWSVSLHSHFEILCQ